MSSINGVGNGISIAQTNPYASLNQNNGVDRDGDNDGSGGAKGLGRGGAFASAIMQALSQIGVSSVTPTANSSESNSGSSSSPDSHQALGAFLHDLFSALHAQGNSQADKSGKDSDGDNDGSSASGPYHRHSGDIAANLQALIQQLGSPDASGNAASANSPLSALQGDFNNLLGSLGASGNQTSLSGFLQAIADNLKGSNPGLNVSSQA